MVTHVRMGLTGGVLGKAGHWGVGRWGVGALGRCGVGELGSWGVGALGRLAPGPAKHDDEHLSHNLRFPSLALIHRIRSQVSSFAPSNLNISAWVESFKTLGATSAVLTAKHGCGFLGWQTKTTLPDGSPYGYVEEERREDYGSACCVLCVC